MICFVVFIVILNIMHGPVLTVKHSTLSTMSGCNNSEQRQMELNSHKYKVMHFGKLTWGRTYTMNDRVLGRDLEQRDVGVHIHSSLTLVT